MLIGELRSEQPPTLNMRMMAANIDLFISNARARDWSALIKWDHGPTTSSSGNMPSYRSGHAQVTYRTVPTGLAHAPIVRSV